MLRKSFGALAVGLIAAMVSGTSWAAVTSWSAVAVDNSSVAELANYATTDIKINFTGQYTVAEMLADLGAGNIYQHANGSNIPPNSAFLGVFPALGYDTFVAQGSPTAAGPFQDPGEVGGAVDLGGAAGATFSNAKIDYAWGPAGGNNILDQTGFLLARLSIAKTVNMPSGAIKFLASAAGQNSTQNFAIVNGCVDLNGSCGGSSGVAPTVADYLNQDLALNKVVSTTVTASGDAPITWGALHDFSYTPGFGAVNPTGISKQPTWNPATQAFSWDTSGSTRGTYKWLVTATNATGMDDGMITVEVHSVPEPATLSMIGLALVGCVGLARRRG